MSLLGFAVAVPSYFLQTKEAPPMNVLFIYLELLGFIYFTYQFKKNRIFFNYSFIEKETGYYREVFKNILKLTILISIVYGITIILSFFIFLLETWLVLLIISLIITFIISIVTLAIYYLFISWMERLSYKGLLNGSKYLKSQMIIGSIYIVINIIVFYYTYKMATFDPENTSNAFKVIYNIISTTDIYIKIGQLLLVMLVSNICLQFIKKPKGISLMIYSILTSMIINLLTIYVGHLDFLSNTMNFHIYSLVTIYINLALFMVYTIGLLLLTVELIKNKMHKIRILIPFVGLILYIINFGYIEFSVTNKIILIIIRSIFTSLYIFSLIRITNQENVLLNEK